MSIRLLETYKKSNTLQDDLESFFWVVTYHILRYTNHNSNPSRTDLENKMYAIFDSSSSTRRNSWGGCGKLVLLLRRVHLDHGFKVIDNEPLTSFFYKTLYHLQKWHRHFIAYTDTIQEYALENRVPYDVAKTKFTVCTDNLAMRTHQAMMDSFNKALVEENQWPAPEVDFLVDNLSESNRHS